MGILNRYEVALGTTPGGSQLREFQQVPYGQLWNTIHSLDLSTIQRVFGTVKGYNAVGLVTTASSNGVWISRASAGLAPLYQLKVWDGGEHGKDLYVSPIQILI